MKYTQLALALSIGATTYAMENEAIVLDLEAATPSHTVSTSRISADLVKAIKKGKGGAIDRLLRKQPTRTLPTTPQVGHVQDFDQLTAALGFTAGELELQKQQMAQMVFDHFWARYKHVAIPAILTAYSTGDIIFGAVAYSDAVNDPNVTVSEDQKKSFAVRIAGSALAAAGFGWYTVRQAIKGWNDHRQAKKVDQLESSEALLLAMKEIQSLKDSMAASGIAVGQPAAVEQPQEEAPANDNNNAEENL